MPSLSKLASATLALTTVFLRGTAAAAIKGSQLEFCDFDREVQASPAPSAARRQIVIPGSPLLQEKPNGDAPQGSAPAASPEIPKDVLDSLFDTTPFLPSVEQKPASVPTPAVDDGRELKVGVYMHIVGQPENNTSPEFFLSVCSTSSMRHPHKVPLLTCGIAR